MKRAIEFGRPPRLPFWQSLFPGIPDDVRDCWEMDRQKAGWFFDCQQWPDRHRSLDDWGCGWEASEIQNMGQVTVHPPADSPRPLTTIFAAGQAWLVASWPAPADRPSISTADGSAGVGSGGGNRVNLLSRRTGR